MQSIALFRQSLGNFVRGSDGKACSAASNSWSCEFGACGPMASGLMNGIGSASSGDLIQSVAGAVELAGLFLPRSKSCPTGFGLKTRMLVTGYDNGFESTGKNPGDPGYGLTASGQVAGSGTIAAPKSFPFGTQMFVPGYGLGTVWDRGGAIKNSHIDLWFPSEQQAIQWGAQHLQVTTCF